MALQQPGLIYRAEVTTNLVITPRMGEGFRVRRIRSRSVYEYRRLKGECEVGMAPSRHNKPPPSSPSVVARAQTNKSLWRSVRERQWRSHEN